MGGACGCAVMGPILNAQMALRFPLIFAHFASAAARLPRSASPANVLLTPDVRALLPLAFLHQLQVALAPGLFWLYVLTLLLAAVGLAVMFLFPARRSDQS